MQMWNVAETYRKAEITQRLKKKLQYSERIPHWKGSRMGTIQIRVKANMTEQVNFITIDILT